MKATNTIARVFFTLLAVAGLLACVCTAGTIGAQLLVTLGGLLALFISARALDRLGALDDNSQNS